MPNQFNDILILKGSLNHAPNPAKGGAAKLRPGSIVKASHLLELVQDLHSIQNDWDNTLLSGTVLVTCDYREIVAKSNRMRVLLKPVKCKHLSELVCGARFETVVDTNTSHHVLVYKTTPEAIKESIVLLTQAADFLNTHCSGVITDKTIETVSRAALSKYGFSSSKFIQVLRDAYFVTRFRIGSVSENLQNDTLVSLYRVGNQQSLIALLHKIGIRVTPQHFLNEDTLLLRPDERQLLCEKAGWLIAMEVSDLTSYDTTTDFIASTPTPMQLPAPTNEPVVGVIDTRFDQRVYFSRWVEYHDCINPAIPVDPKDFRHGTAVTSLIVNGHHINPSLDDGCGYFRVRHFAVAHHGKMSSFDILLSIRKIVRENPDIKVWNLSLGSARPCPENFISPEGAELDRIQRDYDVLFVVAGTNYRTNLVDKLPEQRIGAPADALNPIVVNSCSQSGTPAPYSRKGPILHFFIRPDVSCFGGVPQDYLYACTPNGREPVIGTSYAAPWVARKLAYMIHQLHLTRTQAKALLIDSCAGWETLGDQWAWQGWGCVPTRIEDIVHSAKNEIRFVVSGKIDNYETFNYDLPVPQTTDGKFDYDVRATLCYFPECHREQGVDYPLTELDLHFGRVDDRKDTPDIKSIDQNRQSSLEKQNIPEQYARAFFRKWDNVKVRCRTYKRTYDSCSKQGLWGLRIFSKERLPTKFGQKMPFSLVVTLRSRNGIDRHANFIKACQARGWVVNNLNVENLLSVTAKMEQTVEFED